PWSIAPATASVAPTKMPFRNRGYRICQTTLRANTFESDVSPDQTSAGDRLIAPYISVRNPTISSRTSPPERNNKGRPIPRPARRWSATVRAEGVAVPAITRPGWLLCRHLVRSVAERFERFHNARSRRFEEELHIELDHRVRLDRLQAGERRHLRDERAEQRRTRLRARADREDDVRVELNELLRRERRIPRE